MPASWIAADIGVMTADVMADAITLDGVAVRAFFDNEADVVNTGIGAMVRTPILTLATSAVPASPVGKSVTVNAVAYKVAEHMPDGTGQSVLVLERA